MLILIIINIILFLSSNIVSSQTFNQPTSYVTGFEPEKYKNVYIREFNLLTEITGLSEAKEISMPFNTTRKEVNEEVCNKLNILSESIQCYRINQQVLDEKANVRFELAAPSLVAEMFDASLVVNEVEGTDFWKRQLESLKSCLNTLGPRTFLRCQVIQYLMFAGSRILAHQELNWIIQHTTLNWRIQMLRESQVGTPAFTLYSDDNILSSTNLVHHAYSYARFEDTVPNVKISSLDLIVEFGGGYGSFARVVMNGGFKGRYVIYDLHPFNIIQKYYLSALGFTVRTIDEWDVYDSGIWLVHDLKTLERLHLYERFAENEMTMFVAMFSLSEVTNKLRDSFMALGPGSFHNYFFYFQSKWESLSNTDWFTNFIFNKRSDLRWTMFEDYGHFVGMDEDTGENKPLNKLVIGTFDNRGTFRVDLGEIDNKIVKVVQSIKTLGAAGFESFKINGQTYLAVANFWDGKSKDMEAKSIIYHVTPFNNNNNNNNNGDDDDGTVSTYMLNFKIIQEISTKGAHGVEYFTRHNNHFLAIPHYYGGVTEIYLFDPSKKLFIPHINIQSKGPGQVEVTEINNVMYMIIAENFANIFSIYKYDDVRNTFTKLQQLNLEGASSMAVVKCKSNAMLIGASYFARDNFVTTSIVYLWDEKQKEFHEWYTLEETPGPHDVEAINHSKNGIDYCGFFLSHDRNSKNGESTFVESKVFLYNEKNSQPNVELMASIPTDGAHGAEFFETYPDKGGMIAIANFGNRYQKRYHSGSLICNFPELKICQEMQTYGATDMEHFQLDIGNGHVVDYLIVSNEGDITKRKYQLSTVYRLL